ncbi:MAG: glycosyltransferase family 2 protein, partial [Nanoarchaeota archaeon]
FADADTSTPITELDNFMPQIKGYDIIIGSREHKDSIVKNKLVSRVVLGNLGNILLRLFLIKKIRDTQCGFKLFKGNIARKLFSLSRIKGFGFDFEIIFLAQKNGYKIKEMPVNWAYCEGTKVTWQSHFVTLRELFEIKLAHLFGKYKI